MTPLRLGSVARAKIEVASKALLMSDFCKNENRKHQLDDRQSDSVRQFRLMSMQSPDKTTSPQTVKDFRKSAKDQRSLKENGALADGAGSSDNGSMPTSACNDIEEHEVQLARMPKTSSNAAGMFKRLNEQ